MHSQLLDRDNMCAGLYELLESYMLRAACDNRNYYKNA
jgi:hypothetical protein